MYIIESSSILCAQNRILNFSEKLHFVFVQKKLVFLTFD